MVLIVVCFCAANGAHPLSEGNSCHVLQTCSLSVLLFSYFSDIDMLSLMNRHTYSPLSSKGGKHSGLLGYHACLAVADGKAGTGGHRSRSAEQPQLTAYKNITKQLHLLHTHKLTSKRLHHLQGP